MARAIASDIHNIDLGVLNKSKELTSADEIQRINKVKYNLSIVYFVGIVALLSTLFI